MMVDSETAEAINLGNFLSGMETPIYPARQTVPPALETSLVEWKQGFILPSNLLGRNLGNFLSGMETRSLFSRVA